MNEYIQEDKIEDLLTKELDVLENAISDDNNALAICSREQIWKLIYRLNEQSYNRGVEDSMKCVANERSMVGTDAYDADYSWNDCRQQTIDNITKLLNNK